MIKILSIVRLHPPLNPLKKKLKKEKDEILNLWENLKKISKCIKVRKMFFRLVTSVGKRNILSPHEESNLRPSDLRSDAQPLSHKDSSVSEVYYEVLITRFPHTVRISNVDQRNVFDKK